MKRILTCIAPLIFLMIGQRSLAQSRGSAKYHYTGKVTTLDGQKFHGDISGFGADKLTLAFNTTDGVATQHELSPGRSSPFSTEERDRWAEPPCLAP